MGNAAFRTGWRVLRAGYREAVPRSLRRRRVFAGLIVAVAVGALITVTELVWHWISAPLPLALLQVVVLAAALGSLAAAFTPMRASSSRDRSSGPGTERSVPRVDWRRQDRVRTQFLSSPPAMDPQDRDIVLGTVEGWRIPLIGSATRAAILSAAWTLVVVAVVVPGLSLPLLVPVVVIPAQVLTQAGMFVAHVTNLGRMELARRRAEVLPPAPPEQPRTWPTGSRPSGSKLGLPGE